MAFSLRSIVRNRSISVGLWTVAGIPLVVALLFAVGLLVPKLQETREYGEMERLVELATSLSGLVHEQQKERGGTAVYLTSAGEKFGAELAAQRLITDERLAAAKTLLVTYLDDPARSAIHNGIVADLNDVLTDIDTLAEVRTKIDALELPPAQGIAHYTDMNARIFSVVAGFAELSNDHRLTGAINAFAYFINGKDRAGIERAVGASAFGTGQFSLADLLRFNGLISIQDVYFSLYLDVATEAETKVFADLQNSDVKNEVERLRRIVLSGGLEGNLEGITATDFFAAKTAEINLMKAVEDTISADLLATAQELKSAAKTVAYASAIAALLALFISAIAIIRISREIKSVITEVANAAGEMARGDLQVSVPRADGAELGEISNALEQFRQSIVDGQAREAELRLKEKEDLRRQRQAEMEQQRLAEEQVTQEKSDLADRMAREQAIAREISEVVDACAEGDFSQRLNLEGKDGVFADLCAGINKIADKSDEALQDVSKAMLALSGGDLTHRIDNHYSGVFKEIVDNVNSSMIQLAEIVGRIRGSSSVVHSFVEELAASAVSLAKRTEGNASELENTAISLKQVEKLVKSASQSANGAKQNAASVVDEVTAGRTTVTDAISAMYEIRESSTAITSIIDLINDISFQTNLLALNAGVEAARAGPAGRGFAVVATEVRDLASRSANASQEISTLISQSSDKVDLGVSLVNQSGERLETINTAISHVAANINSVAEMADEQVAGIQEINVSTTQLDHSTQQNAAMFEETSAVITSMKDEAIALIDAVQAFRLNDTDLPVSGNAGQPRQQAVQKR